MTQGERLSHFEQRGESIQNVTRFNNQAPPSPDSARKHESGILSQRELFGGTTKVRDTSDDESPLQKDILLISMYFLPYLASRVTCPFYIHGIRRGC